MQYFIASFLFFSFLSCLGFAELTSRLPFQTLLSDSFIEDDESDDEDSGEVDEDIIIMDEEDNDDEGVNN